MSFIASRCDSELPMPSVELPIKVEVTGIACMLEHMAIEFFPILKSGIAYRAFQCLYVDRR